MKRLLFSAIVVMVATSLSGCGKAKHEEFYLGLLALANEGHDVVDGVSDEASAHAAVPKLENISYGMNELMQRWKTYGEPTREEGEQLEKRFKEQTEKTRKRASANLAKLKKYPFLVRAIEKYHTVK